MNEERMVSLLNRRLRRSPLQRNGVFASDAEIVRGPFGDMALTVDDFSAEDCLPEGDPALLAWNVTIATHSDLLAVGAGPAFMLNSLVVTDATDEDWLDRFACGAQKALDALGARMVGGDVGRASEWRFTGVGVGLFPDARKPMGRLIPIERGAILVTGALGDANLAAITTGAVVEFECRLAESAALSACEAACMDTSDGLARSLEIVTRLNPGARLTVDLAAIPYASFERLPAGAPKEALLLGSAGEYELLAFVAEADAERLTAGGAFTRIGGFERTEQGGLFWRVPRGGSSVAHQPLPDPRECGGMGDYQLRVVELARRVSDGGNADAV